MTRPPSGGLRQVHWGLADQGVSAGTNLVLAVVVARSVSVADFGAFSLVYGLFILTVPLVRSSGATVLSIEHAASPPEHLRRAVREAAGFALGVGAVGGVVVVLAAASAPRSLAGPLAVLGGALPALLLQDMWRGTFLTQGRPRAALANDLVCAAVMLALLVLVLAREQTPEVHVLLAVWGGGGLAGALTGAWQAAVLPRLASPHRWLLRHRALARPLLAAELLTQVPPHLTYLLLPVVSDLGQLGELRGAYLLFGPLGLLYQAVASLALPDVVRLADPDRAHRLALRLTAVLVLSALGWGAAVVLCPAGVGESLLGDAWGNSQSTRLLLAISLLAEALLVGPRILLGSWRQPHRLLRGRLLSAPVLLVVGLGLGAPFGAAGAATGFAAAYLLAAVVSWRQVRASVGVRHRAVVTVGDGAP